MMGEIKIRHKMAKDFSSSNATEISVRSNYNGSGPTAFGGADSWPAVTVRVSLPVGEEEAAEELAQKLALVIEEFVTEKGWK
jgi:hypothetical protein